MNDLQTSIQRLKEAFGKAYKHKVNLVKSTLREPLVSYHATKNEYIRKNFHAALKSFEQKLDVAEHNDDIMKMRNLAVKIDDNDLERLKKTIDSLYDVSRNMKGTVKELALKPLILPEAIHDEVQADIDEMEKCFNNELFRSATILCGRILETVLHRKYYETVGVDLLEKSPGIGLGKIIAKLLEKNVDLDPGLTQQIHLINQIRIFTVHKKQKAFFPSQAQAHAMILYTMDVLEKLF